MKRGNQYVIDEDILRQMYKLNRLLSNAAKGSGKRHYLKHTMDRVLRAGLKVLGYEASK